MNENMATTGSTAAAQAFVCVYRHYFPSASDIRATRVAAVSDPALTGFVADYLAGESYFDWGDDPSFFSALRIQGSAEHAGWGVCRPNVRRMLKAGDVVVFFCAKRASARTMATGYYFVGVGTVKEVVEDRSRIWTEKALAPYRNHYNVLARYSGGLTIQHETFHPYHDNWLHRLASPYAIFDVRTSRFDLQEPLHAATCAAGHPETWHSDSDKRVDLLEKLLFKELGIARRLRTSSTGTAHPHINLTPKLAAASTTAHQLRDALLRVM